MTLFPRIIREGWAPRRCSRLARKGRLGPAVRRPDRGAVRFVCSDRRPWEGGGGPKYPPRSRSKGRCDPFGFGLVLSRAKKIRQRHCRIHARGCRTSGRRTGVEQFGLALSTKRGSGESARVGRASGCCGSAGG